MQHHAACELRHASYSIAANLEVRSVCRSAIFASPTRPVAVTLLDLSICEVCSSALLKPDLGPSFVSTPAAALWYQPCNESFLNPIR